MADDLIGMDLIDDLLDDFIPECRGLAEREGADVTDPASIHDWAESRGLVRDRPESGWDDDDDFHSRDAVYRLARALVARDAVWGVVDYEHEPLPRYLWEIAACVADPVVACDREPGVWSVQLGTFDSCGQTYEVFLHSSDAEQPPHVHIHMVHDPEVPDILVRLDRAEYLPHGVQRWELDRRHRLDLISFLAAEPDGLEGTTNWERAVGIWWTVHGRDAGCTEMPDYELLGWPDIGPEGGDDAVRVPMGSALMNGLLVKMRDRALMACRDRILEEGATTWERGLRTYYWRREKYDEGDPVLRRLLDANTLVYALDYEPLIDFGEPLLPHVIDWTDGIEPEVRSEDVEPLDRALDAPTSRFLDLALAERGARQGEDMDIFRTFGRWLARRYEDGDPEVRHALGLALAKLALVPFRRFSLERPLHAYAFRELGDYIVPSDGDATRNWDEGWNGGGQILGTFRSRGMEFEVVLYGRGGPAEPHIHLRRPRSPRTPDVCVSLVRPAYVSHGGETRELGPGQVEDLAAYLDERLGRDMGSESWRWLSFLSEWDNWRDEDHSDVEMPDYLELARQDREEA